MDHRAQKKESVTDLKQPHHPSAQDRDPKKQEAANARLNWRGRRRGATGDIRQPDARRELGLLQAHVCILLQGLDEVELSLVLDDA